MIARDALSASNRVCGYPRSIAAGVSDVNAAPGPKRLRPQGISEGVDGNRGDPVRLQDAFALMLGRGRLSTPGLDGRFDLESRDGQARLRLTSSGGASMTAATAFH